MKILIVDDSPTIRSIQVAALKHLGFHEIAEAADGNEALHAIAKDRPDLLIVDWNMPGLDGIALVRKVRETDRTLPIIMCSSEADRPRVVEAIKAGVTDYIVKPFTPEGIGEKVRRALAKAAPTHAASAAHATPTAH